MPRSKILNVNLYFFTIFFITGGPFRLYGTVLPASVYPGEDKSFSFSRFFSFFRVASSVEVI